MSTHRAPIADLVRRAVESLSPERRQLFEDCREEYGHHWAFGSPAGSRKRAAKARSAKGWAETLQAVKDALRAVRKQLKRAGGGGLETLALLLGAAGAVKAWKDGGGDAAWAAKMKRAGGCRRIPDAEGQTLLLTEC